MTCFNTILKDDNICKNSYHHIRSLLAILDIGQTTVSPAIGRGREHADIAV